MRFCVRVLGTLWCLIGVPTRKLIFSIFLIVGSTVYGLENYEYKVALKKLQ